MRQNRLCGSGRTIRAGWFSGLVAASAMIGCGGGDDAESGGSGSADSSGGSTEVVKKEVPPGALIAKDITPGRRGGTLVLAMAGDPKTFNVAIIDDAPSQRISGYIYEPIYQYDNFVQGDVEGLAESWEYNESTREWTFHLRQGLRWSDGEPLTSDDMLFYTEVVNDENVPSTEAEFLKTDGVSFTYYCPDPVTFVAQIPSVDSFALMSLALIRPLPRHKYEHYLNEGVFQEQLGTDIAPDELVVSGPFKLKEFNSGEKVVLERNPYYHVYDENGTQLPYLDEIVFLNVADFDAMALRFQSGDLDLLEDIQAPNLPVLMDGQDEGNYKLITPGLSLSNNHYWFNLKPGGSYEDESGDRVEWEPPTPWATPPPAIMASQFHYYVNPIKRKWFDEVDFRRAASMATNRDAMVRTILYGEGASLYGMVGESNKAWHNPDIPKYPYDPEKAKALLDGLNYIDRDGDGVREDPEGNPLRFTIITNKENNIRDKIGVLLKEDMTKLGMDVTLQLVDFNDLITRISDTHDFEVCSLGLASGVPPHPAMGKNTWHSTGRMHQWNPGQKTPATEWEAKIDELYVSLQKTFDVEEQKKIFFEMQNIYSEQQPMIHTVQVKLYVAASNRIGNLKPTILRPYLTHNLDELYIKND